MDNNQGQPSQEVLDRLFENRNDPNVLAAFNQRFGANAAENYLNDTASATLENEALVIPQADINYLKENADNQAAIMAFDKMHGAGQAQSILTPTQQTQTEERPSYGADILQGIAAGAEDIATGTAKFADWVGDSLFGVQPRLVWGDGQGLRIISGEEYLKFKEQGMINPEGFDYISDAETMVGGFAQGVTTFAVPYFGMFGKVAKSGKVFQGIMAGAVIDGTIINPDDPNLTATLEALGADTGIVGELLATDSDDPEWMNRAKNMAEGGVLGLALESVFYGLKAAKAKKAGNLEEAQEYLDQAKTVSQSIDQEIDSVAQAATKDAETTIEMTKRIFPEEEVDGQMTLDLEGTVPQSNASIEKAVKVPYRLTSEQIESIRMMTKIGDLDPQDAAQAVKLSFRSVDTMNDYDDVLSQMSAVKHVMEKEFLEMRGGDVQRWSTVKAQTTRRVRHMADMLGKDPEAFLNEMTGGFKDVPYHKLAAEVAAKDRMLLAMELEIKELGQMIDSGKVTGNYQSMEEVIMAFNARREVAANVLMSVDAARANVGRALNAMKMSRTADKKLREMIKNAASNSDARAVAKAVVNSDQPLKTSLRLGKSVQKTMDMVNHFRINALLSGIGTQQVNLIGTAVNSVMIPMQQILGGQVKHGVRTLAYQLSSSLEALQMASKAFMDDTSILDVLSTKFDMTDDIAKGRKGLGMKVISSPSRFLLAMDEFFKQATYRGRVSADAAMEADNAGLKGAERAEFMRKYILDSFGKNGEAIRADALLQSQRSSFTEALEAGSIGQKFQSLGRGEGVGSAMFRFVVPFVRTPINILSQSFQNMPVLQFVSKRFRDDLFSGDPIRSAQARGKILTGFALGSLGYFLAGRGDFTGSGPTDPRIRAEWLKNNQPYSIKITRDDGSFYWFSYQRLEPLANVLSIFADANEIVRDPYNERETSKQNAVAALMLAVAENTVNKTFTKGLADTFALMLGDPIKSERALYSIAGSFVPNILNQTNGDEAFREVRSTLDALQSRTGLYEGVDPKRNVLGEIIERPTPKYDPMGLSNIGNYRENDMVLGELSRVSMVDRSAFSQFSSSIFMNGKNENLKDMPYQGGPQSLYDKVLEQTSTTKIDGLTLREKLAEVITSDEYKRAIDGAQGLGSKGTKGQIISTVIKAYRDKAKYEIPEYMEILQQSEESKIETIKSQLIEQRPNISQQSLERFRRFNEVFAE
ncbi:hypothetical protein CRP118_gp34 [Roseobacter phage CRP-118]|uniref:Internal virion protein n=1 Tax=Roseobacter phage CRP-118 TaxID=3072843 RepID=A0AAX4G3A1_9CAUD|nr:hypothetical protein CRP118_gp34 [Roseobacter phage CRP-118]